MAPLMGKMMSKTYLQWPERRVICRSLADLCEMEIGNGIFFSGNIPFPISLVTWIVPLNGNLLCLLVFHEPFLRNWPNGRR